MLYVTARDHRDAYTAHRALTLDRGPDGGLFIPFHLPVLSPDKIGSLGSKSFSQTVAEVLNLFFGKRLTAYDVEFCVGRNPARIKALSQRILIGELWHNPGRDFDWTAHKISELLLSGDSPGRCSEWTYVAVRIALLFGLTGQLLRSGVLCQGDLMDVSVVSGDLSAVMAVWYARRMGLPVGDIICCCNENCGIWELLHQGSMRTDAVAVQTFLPKVDIALPDSLERLVYGCGGYSESARYLEICRIGGVYAPNEILLNRMRTGMSVSVVGQKRISETVGSVYSTYSYLMGPYTSLAYAGLLDHRSISGQSRRCLVLADKNPVIDISIVSDALGVGQETVKKLIDRM